MELVVDLAWCCYPSSSPSELEWATNNLPSVSNSPDDQRHFIWSAECPLSTDTLFDSSEFSRIRSHHLIGCFSRVVPVRQHHITRVTLLLGFLHADSHLSRSNLCRFASFGYLDIFPQPSRHPSADVHPDHGNSGCFRM